jgi:hypothetical protein
MAKPDVLIVAVMILCLLDEVYEPIKFGELEYCPSQVLKSVDPIAFDMGANEYADGLVQDGELVCLNGRFYRM